MICTSNESRPSSKIILLVLLLMGITAVMAVLFPILLHENPETLNASACLQHHQFELGDDVVLTVCKKKTRTFLDLRQFVRWKNHSRYPSAKGIQLSIPNWEVLKHVMKVVSNKL